MNDDYFFEGLTGWNVFWAIVAGVILAAIIIIPLILYASHV